MAFATTTGSRWPAPLAIGTTAGASSAKRPLARLLAEINEEEARSTADS